MIKCQAHAVSASTDLASIDVTPLARSGGTSSSWQPVYVYSGGQTPPETIIAASGKWLDPTVRKDADGVTYALPAIPEDATAGQPLLCKFIVDRPLPNYPTRLSVRFTLHYNEGAHEEETTAWSPLRVSTSDASFRPLLSLRVTRKGIQVNDPGANNLVFTWGGASTPAVTFNGADVSASALGKTAGDLTGKGALLVPGIALQEGMIQLGKDKGDWFTINSVKIEQMRPPVDTSGAAAIDLTVPGPGAARISVEAVDARNVSQGFVLHDVTVDPGHYRVYWDGIDQVAHSEDSSVTAPAGNYTFRLTTSKVEVKEIGDIDNSTPPWNELSYASVACTALAITPPHTPVQHQLLTGGFDTNPRPDTRDFDATDSVQLLCVGYDSNYGQWIAANGAVIHTKTGDPHMQYGRSLACTPADSNTPPDPQKQFYFASASFPDNGGVVTASFPAQRRDTKVVDKLFSSLDWNRVPGLRHYQIAIGEVDQMIGPRKYLFFEVDQNRGELHCAWTFSNVRVSEGDASSKPIAFDPTQFTIRAGMKDARAAIPAGAVTVAGDGLSVTLKNAPSVNYPFTYTVTRNTVLSFDFNVLDRTATGNRGNGIGLDTQPSDLNPAGCETYVDLLGGDHRWGLHAQSLGAIPYPMVRPNTLTTEAILPPPADDHPTTFLFTRGYYGLKVSEDGKLLFACNNADNRLEVRDIAGDGGAVATIPIDYPMFVALAPRGAAGAPDGVRYVYVDSATAGLLRVPWRLADNTFGKPELFTPPGEFAWPRGLVYDAAVGRLFVCDSFTYGRAKAANQIAVIDPITGKVLSRFGKPGGVDPAKGGAITDDVFTCPLTIDADSKGALWVNDYFTGEVRKYAYDAATGGLELIRRVEGPNSTNVSHFYWLPGGSPTQVWTVSDMLVRHDADIGADGRLTNQRATDVAYQLDPDPLRPYAHFARVAGHVYADFCATMGLDGSEEIYEVTADGWAPRFAFGCNAGAAVSHFGLTALAGQAATDLDKAITASGDADWQTRPWSWSDLNGDGGIEYTAANPEFKIAFNSPVREAYYIPPSGSIRESDGAYLFPVATGAMKQANGIGAVPPRVSGGRVTYDWSDVKVTPVAAGEPVMDVIGQDGRLFINRMSTMRHDIGADVIADIEAYDPAGKLLWTRANSDFSPLSLEPVGPGFISTLQRTWWHDGPVDIRTTDGDLVCQVYCKVDADCWSQGTMRVDDDTALIGLVQVFKVTGLSTVRSASATVAIATPLPR